MDNTVPLDFGHKHWLCTSIVGWMKVPSPWGCLFLLRLDTRHIVLFFGTQFQKCQVKHFLVNTCPRGIRDKSDYIGQMIKVQLWTWMSICVDRWMLCSQSYAWEQSKTERTASAMLGPSVGQLHAKALNSVLKFLSMKNYCCCGQ